jgi:alpha-tubulin suppressor-like RCC1 family protein
VALGVLGSGCSFVADLGDPRDMAHDDGGTDPEAAVAADDGGDDASNAALQPLAIAVGAKHACAVINAGTSSPQNGTVRCWGQNDTGQLGIDPSVAASSYRPLEVSAISGINQPLSAEAVTLATGYSCALTTDGYFLCWGDVPESSSITRETPRAFWEPSNMDFIAAPLVGLATASVTDEGGCVTLAADSSLVCWGSDLAPTSTDGGVAHLDGGVIVGDLFDTVSVGGAHACGIARTQSSADHDVECWGANTQGQTGMPSSPLVSRPNKLGLGTIGQLLQVATGGNDSCALVYPGKVYCWGANALGQLGSGAGTDSPIPLFVTLAGGSSGSGSQTKQIAVGDGHACALTLDSRVWCWGDNSQGQLGQGGSGQQSATPQVVQKAPGHNLAYVVAIAAGGQTTCAKLFDDKRVWCWGANDYGQAGQPGGGSVGYATPVAW